MAKTAVSQCSVCAQPGCLRRNDGLHRSTAAAPELLHADSTAIDLRTGQSFYGCLYRLRCDRNHCQRTAGRIGDTGRFISGFFFLWKNDARRTLETAGKHQGNDQDRQSQNCRCDSVQITSVHRCSPFLCRIRSCSQRVFHPFQSAREWPRRCGGRRFRHRRD